MIEEIEDDHITLKKKDVTPLSFYCKVGKSYLFSFRKDEGNYFLNLVIYFIGKLLGLIFFLGMVVGFIFIVGTVTPSFKQILCILYVISLIMFILVFLIDPGILFEDEE